MRSGIAALAVLCGLAACSGGSDTAPVAETAPASTAADCTATAGGPVQGSPLAGTASSSVQLGPSSAITEKEAAREAPARKGKPLILTGMVYADCTTPAAGAVINAWQTDARGRYGPEDDAGDLRCCYLQGSLETDANGAFTIKTIRPGHYREGGPGPAHIHLEVHYDGGGVLTEVFFADDPHLSGDAEGEVIELREESGALTGRLDIVLSDGN